RSPLGHWRRHAGHNRRLWPRTDATGCARWRLRRHNHRDSVMVIFRALLVAVVFFMAQGVASAQTGGIRVAPVLVSLSPERAIGSVRLHNGRATPVSFEVEAFVWTQVDGADRLTPTNALIVAPGVFEIAPNSEQTLRLGVRGPSSNSEAAYRILVRELPAPRRDGVALGFALEMSLPVFVTPSGARPNLTTHAEGQ